MKKLLLSLGLVMALAGCSKTRHDAAKQYGRLTVIYGKQESFGIRYFWESPTEKTEAMSFEMLHQHFGVNVPGSDELKVIPRDYKVIARLMESGWSLVAVSSVGGYKEDAGSYKDAITHDPVTTYHFSK
jgi:hypothetical protein